MIDKLQLLHNSAERRKGSSYPFMYCTSIGAIAPSVGEDGCVRKGPWIEVGPWINGLCAAIS